MIPKNQKIDPTELEKSVLLAYIGTPKTCLDIAVALDLTIEFVAQTTNRWQVGKFNYNHQQAKDNNKGKTMAKDKNKKERTKQMEELREGTAVYGVEMDKVRGILGELEPGEALICQRQAATQNVILRLGDVAYT